MALTLTDAERNALGLRDAIVGASVVLPWPVDPVAQGYLGAKAAPGLSTLVETEFADVHFAPAALPLLDALGAQMWVLIENPLIVRFSARVGRTLEVRTSAGQVTCWFDDQEPATAVAQLEPPLAASFLLAHGGGVLMKPGPAGLELAEIGAGGVGSEPLASCRAPLFDWRARCADSWLADQIGRRMSDSTWPHVVSAGMLARLFEPDDPAIGSAAPAVERLADEPRRWICSLSSEQLRTIADLALAEADLLHTLLDDLDQVFAPEDGAWQSEFLATCHRRDDLEGVRLLLAEADADAPVSRRIAALDEDGRLFASSLPLVIALGDERLARVRRRDPAAWWSEPGIDSVERARTIAQDALALRIGLDQEGGVEPRGEPTDTGSQRPGDNEQ